MNKVFLLNNKQGFTLLELLIAISIFAMVMGIAFTSYNTSFTIIQDAGDSAKVYAKAKTVMERLMADLESLYIGDDFFFEGSSNEISGFRADDLQFTSTAFVRLHPTDASPGRLIIHYQVEEDTDSESLLLYRSQYIASADDEAIKNSRLLLCNDLKEVAFNYRNKEGDDVENWTKETIPEDAAPLPALISIRLRFNDAGEEPGTLFESAISPPIAQYATLNTEENTENSIDTGTDKGTDQSKNNDEKKDEEKNTQ
jgi:prepilin-type N-terminal cleavage/methylation domain-containing protein